LIEIDGNFIGYLMDSPGRAGPPKAYNPDSLIKIILNTDTDRGLFLELNGMVVRNIQRKPSPFCSIFVASNNEMEIRLTSITN
jgi:hypothetical protein